MTKIHNTKRAVGKALNNPLAFFGSLALMATGGVMLPNTPLFYDAGPEVEETANLAAVNAVQDEIAVLSDIKKQYNQASNNYYTNLYGDTAQRDAARAEAESLKDQMSRQGLRIATNLYLNPNFTEDDFENLSEQLTDTGVPISIAMTSGNDYELFQNDTEFYKSCQVKTHMNFDDSPLSQVWETDKCIDEANGAETPLNIISFVGSVIGGFIFLLFLEANAIGPWARLEKKIKPSAKPGN